MNNLARILLLVLLSLFLPTSTYAYDHEDTRIRKATSATTTYPNQYFETQGATTTANIFLPDGTLIASITATSTATSTTYVHPDHLGSTNVTTNSNGDVVQTLDYYPYGSERIDSSTGVDETRKFVGMERDDESGLDYATARYYDNARGQFLSQDPSFLDIGAGGFEAKYERTLQQHLANPQALNSYSWALNNPIIQKDPEGEIVPLLIAVYAAFEIGLSAYDAYTTASTLANPNASGGEKALTAGGFVAGLALPGGGYGTAAKAVANKLPDATSVCRGGTCSAGNFLKGSNEYKTGLNPTLNTPLTGISVNIGDNVGNLLQSGPLSRYGQFGQSTVGNIKNLGGSVVPDGNKLNPSHANVSGLNARQLESTFSPTQKNSYKTK